MRLKYHQEILKCNDYDLENFKETARIAYRWVFEDITAKENFLPINLLRPKLETIRVQSFWALSFHSNISSSICRYRELTSNKKHLQKRIGTHIAKGILNVSDGISNNHNREGHFDFFEYEDVQLNNNFAIERIIDD
jgi:hypothetical protein